MLPHGFPVYPCVGGVFMENGYYTSVLYISAKPATTGNNALLAASPGEKYRVLGYVLQGTGTVTVKFTDTDGATISQEWDFQAREGVVASVNPPSYLFEAPAGKGIQVNLSANVAVNVTVMYVKVPA